MRTLIIDKCISCGSVDIEGDSVEIISGKARQECRCNDCEIEWIDEYKLANQFIIGDAQEQEIDVLEINKTLVTSTAHLTESECNHGIKQNSLRGNLCAFNTGYGWRIRASLEYCPIDNLKPLLQLAIDNGCQWLEIDQDGNTIDGLPVFDW